MSAITPRIDAPVSEDRSGDPIQALVVATHDDLEKGGLPGLDSPHNLLVRDVEVLGILSQ